METIMLPIDPDAKMQAFTITLDPNGNSTTFLVELDYRAFVGKYFMSVSNANTGEGILTNFPVVSSAEGSLNDMLKQVAYKLCGSLVCYPLQHELTFEDPTGTISEYELLWGDSMWMS